MHLFYDGKYYNFQIVKYKYDNFQIFKYKYNNFQTIKYEYIKYKFENGNLFCHTHALIILKKLSIFSAFHEISRDFCNFDP